MNARLDFFKGKSGSNSSLDGVRELEESQEANFGLVMEGTSAEYMLHDRCDFYTVGSLATRFYSFGLPKGKIVFFSYRYRYCKLITTLLATSNQSARGNPGYFES